MSAQQIIIVGAGVYGLTAALELRRRGYRVSLLDPGPLPHPLAASTDISKAIRMDYGADEEYLSLMETALERWRDWNKRWGTPLFHETGLTYLCRGAMAPGGFEYESYQTLLKRGHGVERLRAADVRRRFPAWNADQFTDGYFNPAGGYAESGAVVTRLLSEARALGVELHEHQTVTQLIESRAKVNGVVTQNGTRFVGDLVILATGAWTPHLLPQVLPELKHWFRSTGMPVFHFKPAQPELFAEAVFPTFGADIANTGYYGFPLHPVNGVVKIANHGVGRTLHPNSPERVVTDRDIAQVRAFLAEAFPVLAEAPIVYTRVCLYCDTWDGHFWIAADPNREGLVLATGDSGHGFKFAPILGGLIADAAERRANAVLAKFRWRPAVHPPKSEEAARYQAEGARHDAPNLERPA